MPISVPLDVPNPPPGEVKPKELLAEQQAELEKVIEYFSSPEYKLPGVEDGELTEEEKFWLTSECILRFLRGSKWSLSTAQKRLEDTLKWRREFGLSNGQLTESIIDPDGQTGKMIIFGYDTDRRPALYMIPSRQNTDTPDTQLKFAIWMFERSIDLMGPGVETVDFLINFADKAKNPSLSMARNVLNILQSHYPERLGYSFIINVPFLVNAFFKLIMPFVDPITRQKVKFNPDVFKEGFMTKDQMMSEWWGGDHEFQWDSEQYWPAFLKMTSGRRKQQKEKWRELGARIGISELEIKDSTDAPATPVVDEKLTKEIEPVTVDTVEVNMQATAAAV